jgi:hypothetical protein
MTLYDSLQKFSEVNFRDIYQKFTYIDCRQLLNEMLPGELDDPITGMIVYCYIDRTEGISFRPFMIAALGKESLQTYEFPHLDDTLYVLRLREGKPKMNEIHENDRHMYLYAVDPNKYSFMDLSILNFDTDAFIGIKNMVDENYYVSEAVEDLRSDRFAFLDKYRHPRFPDDVQALLYREENGIEQVWVRLAFATKDNELFGELLNEPNRDYGCHEKDLIELKETDVGDEKVLVFTGRIARAK